MTDIKQRAVGHAQKQQRVEQILNAAATRFAQQHYNDIRLVDIATDVGITKAAVYRYFRNKEMVFLALYEQQISALEQQAKEFLAKEPLVPALTNAILSVPLYSKLTAILHTILERNLTVQEAVYFKQSLASKMSGLVNNILPYIQLPPEEVVKRFLMLHHCIIGAWANCHPGEVVQDAMAEHPELAFFIPSYREMLSAHIAMVFAEAK